MGTEPEPIRVLHVDDDRAFGELTEAFLERESDRIAVETVATAGDGLERLDGGDIDCVVSDYEMPGMDGIDFLRSVRERYPTIPFILFTGKGSETIAAEAVAADVSGYLQKGETETFQLLGNRIENEVDDHRITTSYREYETIIESLTDPVYVLDEAGRFTDVNDAFLELTGYDRATVIGSDPSLIKSPEEIERAERNLGRILSEDAPDDALFEVDIRTADCEAIPCEDHMGVIPYEGERFRGSVGVLRDISERRHGETFRKELYELAAASDAGFEGTCRRMLALGCERLGTDDGKLVRIDEPTASHETVVTAHDTTQDGTVADLSRTYCRRIVETGGRVAFSDADAAEWDGDPAAEAYGHACYVGTEVTVDGDRYGTVCFFGAEPRPNSFSDAELTFVDLIAQALGQLIERERAERSARKRKDALESIHAIVSDHDSDRDEQLQSLLDLGRDTLGTEYAAVSRIDDDRYEIVALRSAIEGYKRGDALPLSKTGCEYTVAEGETKAVAKLSEDSHYATHPVHTELGFESYIGTLLYREDDQQGTLCFLDRSGRNQPFSEWERAFVELLSQWVRYLLDGGRKAHTRRDG